MKKTMALIAAIIIVVSAGTVFAACSVVGNNNGGYGRASGYYTEAFAKLAAKQRCVSEGNSVCNHVVTCSDPGYGAIVKTPLGKIAASCGQDSAYDALIAAGAELPFCVDNPDKCDVLDQWYDGGGN